MRNCKECGVEVGKNVHRCERCRIERNRAAYFTRRGLPVAPRTRRAPYEQPRKCRDCGTSMSHRGTGVVRCKVCIAKRKCRGCGKQLANNFGGTNCRRCEPRRKKRRRVNCIDCGTSIADRGSSARRCVQCARSHELSSKREYWKDRFLRQRASDLGEIACLECGVTFMQSRRGEIFCSGECRRRRNKSRIKCRTKSLGRTAREELGAWYRAYRRARQDLYNLWMHGERRQ